MAQCFTSGTRHAVSAANPPEIRGRRRKFLHTAMALNLICPKCDGATQLRGTMDAWYLTWCPECERLWRLELHSLLDDVVADASMPSPGGGRLRSRPRP